VPGNRSLLSTAKNNRGLGCESVWMSRGVGPNLGEKRAIIEIELLVESIHPPLKRARGRSRKSPLFRIAAGKGGPRIKEELRVLTLNIPTGTGKGKGGDCRLRYEGEGSKARGDRLCGPPGGFLYREKGTSLQPPGKEASGGG